MFRILRPAVVVVTAALLILISGCESSPEAASDSLAPTRLNVVCTTAMVADLVSQVAGEYADVSFLIPTGLDPHTYKPSQGDVQKITSADVVVYSGLGLEAKMESVLENYGKRPDKWVHALGSGVDKNKLLYVHGGEEVDPHFWFDIPLWSSTTVALAEALGTADAANADGYKVNASATQASLQALHEWATAEMLTIPDNKRMLITVHDAFSYLGRTYNIEVRGLMGVSPTGGAGIQDVSALVDFLASNEIPAVFVESSLPTRNMEAVLAGCASRGHQVSLGGSLYADSTGPEGSGAETFEGTVRHNVNTLVNALK